MTASDDRIHILAGAEAIQTRVAEMACDIAGAGLYAPLAVAVLKGSFIFAADLLRALHREGVSVEMSFLALSSYGKSTASSGTVTVRCDIDADAAGRDILLIEDLLDTGRTVAFAKDLLLGRGARRVLVAAIADKPERREADVNADFIGFVVPDVFIVGYGIDMAERYRGLPFLGHVASDTN